MTLESFIKKYRAELLFGLILCIGTTLLFVFFNTKLELTTEEGNNLVGLDAPEIEFEAVDGSKASIKKNKGTVILVNFWASWCLPCIEEMPHLKILENHFAERGFILFAINVEEKTKEKVRNKIAKNEMPTNLIYNISKNYLKPYNINSLPLSILIDKESKIYKVYSGSQNWIDHKIISEIDKLLN